ncbi:MAG: hypothetical protein KF887_14080 [Paracoccaceae bacterium]|nr:MAG: hypothetical protein KF887_14080 [Paracoccaceae bacterium]
MAKPKGHDWDGQRAETFETFAELGEMSDLPTRAVVHFLFIAENVEPDWAGFEAALRAKGFAPEWDEDEGMVDAAFGPMPVTAEAIWAKEREATEIALRFEFWPDGWDMLES